MAPGSGVETVSSGISSGSGQYTYGGPTDAQHYSNSYGSTGPTNFASSTTHVSGDSAATQQLEQYAALRNAAAAAAGGMPTAGTQGNYPSAITVGGGTNVPYETSGQTYSTSNQGPNYGPPTTSYAQGGIPTSSNYVTTASSNPAPRPNLVSRQIVSGPVGQGTTTQVKGDPRSNTISLTSRTLKDGRGCVIEAIDTYCYKRPETTNGEYGNFPQRTHEVGVRDTLSDITIYIPYSTELNQLLQEHVLSGNDNVRPGTLTSAGGPGTAEERPTLERHGNVGGVPTTNNRYLP
ncbi:hypothetical protein HDV00_012624 [Rhizophlyctis rosea]|nr:hypothetical protein HDV00_012624 [Rhizophlyctis rosea]